MQRIRPIQVVPYTFENFKQAIIECFEPPRIVEAGFLEKCHLDYFESYFDDDEIKAQTMVIEEPYTDRAYLEDYAAYYVRCLAKYSSRCARFHFFRNMFTQDDLDALVGKTPGNLTDAEFTDPENYLGFVVVKPLPVTIFGRTCLRTYGPDGTRRQFPVTRPYPVHLLGRELEVESLAFQEQDTAVAACATSALWSAFHGTAKLFQHSIHSPVDITRIATSKVPGQERALPNHGLTGIQMAATITEVGLEPELVRVRHAHLMQGVAYAYLKAGIPVLMLAKAYDCEDPDQVTDRRGEPLEDEEVEGHAILVTGYSLGNDACVPHPDTGTLFTHSRIDQLYCHDDQVGPFARMPLGGPLNRETPAGTNGDIAQVAISNYSLKSSWSTTRDIRFAPYMLMVPLYHKIRITYKAVLEKVLAIDFDFEVMRRNRGGPIRERMEWDIRLTMESDFKADIRDSDLAGERIAGILKAHYPRFLWRATATSAGQRIIEFLYDSTDIESGDFSIDTIWWDHDSMVWWYTQD